jgi:hypothetical protein
MVVGIWAVVFLFAAGNEFLAWGFLGESAKLFRVIVMGGGLLAYFRFGPRMLEEIDAETKARRQAEAAAERARDKSNDAAEGDRVRRSIGMKSAAPTHPEADE